MASPIETAIGPPPSLLEAHRLPFKPVCACAIGARSGGSALDPIAPFVEAPVDPVTGAIEPVLDPITGAVETVVDPVTLRLEAIGKPVTTGHVRPCYAHVVAVLDKVTAVIETLVDVLSPAIEPFVDAITAMLESRVRICAGSMERQGADAEDPGNEQG
jgi:hypothetical protein